MSKFQSIPEEIIKEIAVLAFQDRRWVTSDMEVKYQPYIKEWLDDAEEYFTVKFRGYFMGDVTAEYTVNIYPSWNVCIWYTEEKTNVKTVMHVSNQSKIQELLNPYK